MNFYLKPRILPTFLLVLLLGLSMGVSVRSQTSTDVLQQALEQFNNKEYREALDNFNIVLDMYPKDPELNYYSGICLTELNHNLNTAIYRLKLASLGTVAPDVYYYLGKANYQLDHYDEALNYFNRFSDYASREDEKKFKSGQWIAWSESKLEYQSSGKKALKADRGRTPVSDHNLYMGRARSDQHKSDSLFRKINSLNKKISSLEGTEKEKIAIQISELQAEATALQLSANEYSEKAKQVEETGVLESGKYGSNKLMLKYNRSSAKKVYVPGRTGSPFLEQESDAFYKQPAIKKIINPNDIPTLVEIDDLNKKYNKTMQESWSIDKDIEKQKTVANAAASKQESKLAERKIRSLKQESRNKKLDAFEGYKVVNSVKYNVYSKNIDRLLADRSNEHYKEIERLSLNSRDNSRDAMKLQAEAEMVTALDDKYDLLSEANAYELLALENQKKALALYAGIQNNNRSGIMDPGKAVEIPKKAHTKKPDGKTEKAIADKGEIIKKEEPRIVMLTIPEKHETLIVEESNIAKLSEKKADKDVKIELKEEKVYDFSILPTPDYNKMKPIPVDEDMPEGVSYKIQLGVYRNLRPQSFFMGLQPISAETVEGKDLIRYFAGIFPDHESAKNALKKVRKNEFGDAFIVAYYNGEKISTGQARQLEKGIINASANDETETHNVYYLIQIGVYSKEVSPEMNKTFKNHAGDKKLEHFVNNKGLVVYTIGKFLTFDSASSFNKDLKDKGLSDSFVIAYDGNDKITVREARILLNNN